MLLRYLGDIVHLLSLVTLFVRVCLKRNSSGISIRTQDLYTLVFLTRYVDLLWDWSSMFNVVMKIIFVVASVSMSVLLRVGPYACQTDHVDFVPRSVLIASAVLISAFAWYVEGVDGLFEYSWKFSIALESIAIVPQLILLTRVGMPIETYSAHYLALLGSYRMLYMASWAERWFLGMRQVATPYVWLCALVQNFLFLDVVYTFYKKKRKDGLAKPVEIDVEDSKV